MYISKKIICLIFLLIAALKFYALDLSFIEGAWAPIIGPYNIDTDYYTSNKYKFVKWTGYKTYPYDFIVIDIRENPINGRKNFFCVYNADHYIENTKWIEEERKFILSCRYFRYEDSYNDGRYLIKEADIVNDYEINYIDEDEIRLSNFDGFSGIVTYYRIDSPGRIPPQNAVLNDSRVRLRVKPNLHCDTWTLLEKGTKCIVKDKSKEPLEIDGESWYWYRVGVAEDVFDGWVEGYPDGWVYGKYLDIEK